jgi:putative tricarboxylic transport membrane protein
MQTASTFDLGRWLRTALVIILLLMFSYVVWASQDFMLGARLFPQYVGTAGIILCVLELLRQAIRRGREAISNEPSTADLVVEAEEQTVEGYIRAGKFFGWVLYYYGLIFLVGFTLATAIFVPSLLTFRFRAPLKASAGIVAGLVLVIWLLQTFLMLRLPRGIIPLPF